MPKKLITHDGSFHADDIFACAIICLMLEKNNETFEIIRTRDEKIIKNGDYVFDVGDIYDESTNRFDHHQIGGAGKRIVNKEGQPAIEYASFGLVWKKFGQVFTKEKKVIEFIDERLAAPIDAFDNGFDLVVNKYNTTPYYIQHLFASFRPTWNETESNTDEVFFKCVEIAKAVLIREIKGIEDILIAEESVISIYRKTEDKKIIILDKHYPWEYTLNNFPEPLFVIYQNKEENMWRVKAVKENPKTFVNRKNLPKIWAGLRDEDLQNVSGVKDAIFCHRGLFLAVAKSKEGAIKLAQIAVES